VATLGRMSARSCRLDTFHWQRRLWRGLGRLDVRRSFRKRLGAVIAATVLGFSLLLTGVVGTIGQTQAKTDRGELLAQLAYQLAGAMDRDMHIYYQQIQTLAALEEMQGAARSQTVQRQLLDRLQTAYHDLAWIGLASPQGKVLVSTQGILEGENVSGRPWFETGKERPNVQDVHLAKLLATLVPNPRGDQEPLRFVDLATPVSDAQGQVVAVLGAHLYWHWATLLRDNLLKPIQQDRQVEIFIAANNGDILLEPSPNPTITNLSDLPSFTTAHRGQLGFEVESWADQDTYLVGYAPTQGYRDYPGLGWVVLVRQPTEVAFVAARSLMRSILIWGTVLGLVSGALTWWLSGRMVKPVLAIATTAERLRQGDRSTPMPIIPGRDEIAQLSRSVAHLFANLEQQRSLLQTFNTDLEHQVADRTASLNALNLQLRQEIDVRQRAESALQQANQELQRITLLDGLTGITNRRGFDQYLDQTWHQARRSLAPLSLLLLDVDHFKAYNDHYGHPAGDVCLQRVAQAIQRPIHRATDLVARYGGEEFAVILPNTDATGARHIAERLRQAVEDLALPHAHSSTGNHVSISLGSATIHPDSLTVPEDLIAIADHNLYQAKQQGRNRVVGQDHPPITRQHDEIDSQL
jgi:diguanylate cyclase (GGDEF)-like protein